MWPFKKKIPEPSEFPSEKKKPPEPSTVEVGRVEVVLILESGERETFSILGKARGGLRSPAMERLYTTIETAHKTGFFGFGREGQYARWIPTRRVKEILTTEWPHKVVVE